LLQAEKEKAPLLAGLFLFKHPKQLCAAVR